MKKLIFVLSILLLVFAVLFLFLPMGSIGILPSIIAVILILGYLKIDSPESKKRLLLWVSVIILVISLAKIVLVSDEVVIEKEYEEKLENSKQEAIDELDELESELDSIE